MPEVGDFWRAHQEWLDANPPPGGGVYPAECTGALRVEEALPKRPMVVRCDACGLAMGVLEHRPVAAPAPARDRDKRSGKPRRPKPDYDDDAFLGAT